LYDPASPTVAFDKVKVEVVAPEIFPPFTRFVVPFLHWYVKPLPVAVILKVAVVPEQIAILARGCTVIAGASLTVSETLDEVTGEHGDAPVMTTW
jgi:hypothetical protein